MKNCFSFHSIWHKTHTQCSVWINNWCYISILPENEILQFILSQNLLNKVTPVVVYNFNKISKLTNYHYYSFLKKPTGVHFLCKHSLVKFYLLPFFCFQRWVCGLFMPWDSLSHGRKRFCFWHDGNPCDGRIFEKSNCSLIESLPLAISKSWMCSWFVCFLVKWFFYKRRFLSCLSLCGQNWLQLFTTDP